MDLSAMAVLGLLSSLHCAAMCGPIVVAGGASLGAGRGRRHLGAYLGARLISYVAIGSFLGALGQHALCDLPAGKVQAGAAVFLALFAAWQGARVLGGARPGLVTLGGRRGEFARFMAAMLPRRGAGLGAITGLLPCGALWGAYAIAATSASAAGAGLLMAVFALASMPGLILPGLLGAGLARRISWSPTLQAVGWWSLAAWSALRPLLSNHQH